MKICPEVAGLGAPVPVWRAAAPDLQNPARPRLCGARQRQTSRAQRGRACVARGRAWTMVGAELFSYLFSFLAYIQSLYCM